MDSMNCTEMHMQTHSRPCAALSIKCQPQTQAPLAAALRPERLSKEGGRHWGKRPERSLGLRRGAMSHQQERG